MNRPDWLTDEQLAELHESYALAGAVAWPEWATWIVGFLAAIAASAIEPGAWFACIWPAVVTARAQGKTPPRCAACGMGPCKAQLACQQPDADCAPLTTTDRVSIAVIAAALAFVGWVAFGS